MAATTRAAAKRGNSSVIRRSAPEWRPAADGDDQFGSHVLGAKKAQLVCAPFVDTNAPPAPRFVDNGDGTVSDTQTGLIWEMKTADCPGGYTASGTYTTTLPSTGTFTITVDASGTTWTGSNNDSVVGMTSDCAGTLLGFSFTGTCYGGIRTVSGMINCLAQDVSITISGGFVSGSGSGTATGSDPHDVFKEYSWSIGSPYGPSGTAYTDFLYALNGGTSPDGVATSGCFTGHCDWRLPTIEELQTILLAPYPCGTVPCIDPIFGPLGFNPMAAEYWSGTTKAGVPSDAWGVTFYDGSVFDAPKSFPLRVRAVRGGS